MRHPTSRLFFIFAAAVLAAHCAVGQTASVDSYPVVQPAVEAIPPATPDDSAVSPEHSHTAPGKDNTILLLGVLGGVVLIAVSAALGSNGSLVIYASWFDFWLSAALPILFFVHEPWVPYVAGLILLLSVEFSCRANRSLLKILLVFPAKFGLPFLTLLSGVLALGSVSRLLKGEVKDGRDAAMTAATGAACAAGFWFLTKFIRRLVEGELSINDETPESNPENL